MNKHCATCTPTTAFSPSSPPQFPPNVAAQDSSAGNLPPGLLLMNSDDFLNQAFPGWKESSFSNQGFIIVDAAPHNIEAKEPYPQKHSRSERQKRKASGEPNNDPINPLGTFPQRYKPPHSPDSRPLEVTHDITRDAPTVSGPDYSPTSLIPKEYLSPGKSPLRRHYYRLDTDEKRLGQGSFGKVVQKTVLFPEDSSHKEVAQKIFGDPSSRRQELKHSQRAPLGAAFHPIPDRCNPSALLMPVAKSDLATIIHKLRKDHLGLAHQTTHQPYPDLVLEQYLLQLISTLFGNHKAFQETGVAHLDVKPENILLSLSTHVLPSDLASVTPFSEIATTIHLGSPAFAPPEFLGKTPPYTSKMETFSYGFIALVLLLGEHPLDLVLNEPEMRSFKETTQQALPERVKLQIDPQKTTIERLQALVFKNARQRNDVAAFTALRAVTLESDKVFATIVETGRFPAQLSAHPVVQILLDCMRLTPDERPDTASILQVVKSRFEELQHRASTEFGIQPDQNFKDIVTTARSFHLPLTSAPPI